MWRHRAAAVVMLGALLGAGVSVAGTSEAISNSKTALGTLTTPDAHCDVERTTWYGDVHDHYCFNVDIKSFTVRYTAKRLTATISFSGVSEHNHSPWFDVVFDNADADGSPNFSLYYDGVIGHRAEFDARDLGRRLCHASLQDHANSVVMSAPTACVRKAGHAGNGSVRANGYVEADAKAHYSKASWTDYAPNSTKWSGYVRRH